MYSAATGRSRRGRCTRPTAARSPTSTRSPPSCATSCSARLGQFPLFNFWGPAADIASSRWIADCARHVYDDASGRRSRSSTCRTSTTTCSGSGPAIRAIAAATSRAVDALCGELIAARAARRGAGRRALGVRHHAGRRRRSTSTACCARPGCSRCATSSAASCSTPARPRRSRVADHQVAHVYVRRPERVAEVKRLLEGLPGVERVLDEEGKRAARARSPALGRARRGRAPRPLVHATTTGSTTRARPTSRAPSTSTASPATTRSSCSSTRRSGSRRRASGGGSRRRRSASAT